MRPASVAPRSTALRTFPAGDARPAGSAERHQPDERREARAPRGGLGGELQLVEVHGQGVGGLGLEDPHADPCAESWLQVPLAYQRTITVAWPSGIRIQAAAV
jgi:hypothetical protein